MASELRGDGDSLNAGRLGKATSSDCLALPGEVFEEAKNNVIVEQLRSDPFYRLFLGPDFDAKFVAAKAVENLAITDHLSKIAAGMSHVPVDSFVIHEGVALEKIRRFG